MTENPNPMNGPEPKRKPRPVRDEDWDEFAKREPAMRKRETDKAPLFRKGDDGR